MISRRTLFKKFRKWFEPCFNDPMRLSPEQFKGLLLDMLGVEDYNDEEIADVMKKLGFQERRNVKGTFYIRPTQDLYIDAQKRMMLNRISLIIQRKI